MIIIGVTGKAQHGKDTFANHLLNEYGFESRRFAWKLKQIVQEVFDLSTPQIENGAMKEFVDQRWGKSPRQIMQWIGTEGFRAIHPDVWVRDFAVRLKATTGRNSLVVIPDVRFPNEAAWIKAVGGMLVRVVKTGVHGGSNHASEIEMESIEVDKTVDALPGDLFAIHKGADDIAAELSLSRV